MSILLAVGLLSFAASELHDEPARCRVEGLIDTSLGHHYPLGDVQRFVREATVIVRAVAVRSDGLVLDAALAEPGWEFIQLRVIETIAGPPVDQVTVHGRVVDHDDFNSMPVPYLFVRGSGQRGDCFAREYRVGAEYLLLLKGQRGQLDAYWAPLAPINEQIIGANDPWVQWVRTQR